ncbi:Ig-like domain repeat protein [Methanobrevibacter thaueri]|uniref:Putative outer membrane protein pmp9 n=1 Tax=Methanobrevibacter thaueri TaxID=190975 RepID=A0A315XQK1_9EURY|nr:Ig-like domain repeat protein [Methanobrevibacter thaueri]PWB88283.1 putative outer membrane protein pmp9 precursor [Methanobrevibacter thaueri]
MIYKKSVFFLLLIVLILGISTVSATDDTNVTLNQDNQPLKMDDSVSDTYKNNISEENSILNSQYSNELLNDDESEIITVNNWDELQYYCSLTDKDYTLKLKENTNFYPTNYYDKNYQIVINNNVKIIGANGSYIGDSSQHDCYIKNGRYVVEGGYSIKYAPIIVPDNNRMDLTLENITFKWDYIEYSPDGVFIQMGGNGKYLIKNCVFESINTMQGHSCIVYLKKGDALLENCSFINCTTDFGCVSLYHPSSFTNARMIVKDCYFENNFARTEPGCINNCAILTVYNTTFYKNRAGVWAGAIHTHYGASATIYDSNFTDNVAGWNGGALYTYSDLKIYNTIFVGNNCTTNNGGGAIGACKHVTEPHIYIENSLFENNENLCWSLDELSTTGTGRGGAISLMDAGSLEVRNTTFISNAASIGTAICALVQESYGSPDVIIVNNNFINHTRAGDVLNIKVDGTVCNISGNYYIGNSIEFSYLTLTKLNEGKEQSTLQITASLKNPSYYDSDILDKTLYDVYVSDKYVKTVNSTIFTLDFGDLDICDVYVIPTISNRKSNEVTLVSTREYIFVSKLGSDNNGGNTRDTPVKTIKKALELAQSCQNIIILDGDYSENLEIDYDLTLKGEGNATLTGDMSFNVKNVNFTLKNININNLSSSQFIKQESGNLIINNCIFANNDGLIIDNSGFTTITNSILLNNTNLINSGANYNFDYNWWGNTLENFQDDPFEKINNWLVLNATSNVDKLEVNQVTNINFGFYLIENNTVSKYNNLRDINLEIHPINGTSPNQTSSNSKIEYTLTALGNGKLTASYMNINTTVNFEFVKTNPNIKITTEDIMLGDDLIVKINLPKDITGNITVKIDDYSQTNQINSSNLVFTFKNLKANNYIIKSLYSGDNKYLSKEISNLVSVSKYESTTSLDIGAVNVGEDVILTITPPSDATGNVTLNINNVAETLILNNSKANYTIKNIKRGDYKISATYNGDDKYLASSDSKFIEVDNLNATMSVVIDDIVYGDVALIQVTLNDDAIGFVTVAVDGVTNTSDVENGKANIKLGNLEAGMKDVTIFYTGDDTYFNKTMSFNFTIGKAELTFEISSNDIKIGQEAHVHIKVPAKTTGNFTIGADVINIPMSGIIDYVISDLELGEYEITAVYNGNNYYTIQNSTSFTVLEYESPQWANIGSNSQNTGQSPYESNVNGEVAFSITIADDIIGNLVIDSIGNIYVATKSVIYSFDSQGNLRWNYSSESLAGNFSGLSIGRDVIISPSAGDTLYFINQTDGYKYGSSNLYQASSLFAPIIDSNANLYIASEYQYDSNGYKLVKVPYKSWEYGGEISLIDLGNVKPLTSPTVNEDIIVVLSEGRLRVLDAKSLQTKFIKSGNYASVKPIIGEGNVIYVVLGDSIVAYSSTGSQLWKTKVTGGVKGQLVLDSENGLYSINSKGNLFKYDSATGKEGLISNLEITSGVLIGNNGDLYFAVNETFYCINSHGNILWKSVLNSKIIGNPIMDANGTVYVTLDDNKVYALTHGSLKDPNLIVLVENNMLSISIDNQTTGDVSFTFDGVDYVNVFSKSILSLSDGDWQVNVTYNGDARFVNSSKIVKFSVKTKLTGSNLVMAYTSGSYYKVRLTQNGVPLSGKTISFTINGKKTTAKTNTNGYASVKITLPPKTYTVYAQYGKVKVSNTVTVKSIVLAKNLNVKKSAKSLKIKVTLSKVNKKYLSNKKVTLKFNGKTYNSKTNKKGVVTFTIKKSVLKKLKAGKKYTYQVTYLKNTVKKTINVKK